MTLTILLSDHTGMTKWHWKWTCLITPLAWKIEMFDETDMITWHWQWHSDHTGKVMRYWHSLIMLARIPSSSWLPWHDNVTLAMTLRSYWLGNVILAMELPPVLFSNSIINWLYKYNTRLYSKYNHGHMYNKLLKCKSSFCSTYTAQTPWWNYLPLCLDSIHYLWP